MAGAITSISSRPIAPCSPACGFSPATASRGAAMPKSRRNAASVARAVATMASVVTPSSARRSETWIVTGTTRSRSQASIMTGVPPVSSPRNSVWPGWRKPAAYSTALLIGLVTTAPASPACTRRTARSMLSITAGALAGSGWPGRAMAGRSTASTGRAAPNTSATWSGRWITAIGTSSAPTQNGSAKMAKAGPLPASARQALAVISPPMPAGSPMVSSSGRVMRRTQTHPPRRENRDPVRAICRPRALEQTAMTDRPRFFDDLAGVAGGAFSAFAGLRDEAEATIRARIDEAVRKLELVRREDLEAVEQMAANARAGQEAAEALHWIVALELRVAGGAAWKAAQTRAWSVADPDFPDPQWHLTANNAFCAAAIGIAPSVCCPVVSNGIESGQQAADAR